MRSLVIGYGSIGRRHARLLAAMGHEVAIVSNGSVEERKKYATVDTGINEFDPDYVVVCNRTANHFSTFSQLAELGFAGRVMMEKPLFDSVQRVPTNRFSKIGVGYNLRFHPVMRALKKALANRKIFSAHAYVAQYLPDWRPTTDYRESSSARKRDGGGVLRDLSHELDSLTWLLGPWCKLTAAGGKYSDLEIDSDDVFSLLVCTDNCPSAVVHMNYLDRTPRREFIANTETGTIRADFNTATLEAEGQEIQFDVDRDDTYIAEHKAILDGGDPVLCTIEEGLAVTAMIDAAERAAAQNCWVVR